MRISLNHEKKHLNIALFASYSMAEKEVKKKATNLDEVLDELAQENSASLDQSFKAHDKFMREEHQNHLFNNVLAPAQDKLYQSISSELDKLFSGNDETKLKGKEKEIKKAVLHGLKTYFNTVQPSVTKIVDELGMTEEDQYHFLTGMYDDHIAAGKIKDVPSIRSLEEIAKNNKATVGHLKRHIYDSKAKSISGAMQLLISKNITHHFSKYHPTAIAAYLKPQIEKAGFEIEDKVGYASAELQELLGLRKSIIEKEGHAYLKKKEDKDKK